MTIRILHIGTGSRGRHWLEIVRDYPDAVTVGCVDNDAQALDEARRLVGPRAVQFHTDLSAALSEVQADVALITSPSFLHAEHALKALEAGLTVLTEKPFATRLSDAHEVICKARAVGKHIIVAENYRFFRAERTVAHWLARGRLGRIGTVVCVDRRQQPPSEQAPWVAHVEHPQLEEIAVHHFDSFRYLFQRNAAAITARTFNPAGSLYRSGAATEALIEMEGGVRILYFGTLVSHRYEYSLSIEGEDGCLWSDRKRVWWRRKGARFFSPVRLVPVPKGDERPYPRAGTTSLLNQVRDAVLHNQEGETSGSDNFWTLAMVAAAAQSAKESRQVALSEVTRSITSERDAGRLFPGSPQELSVEEDKGKSNGATARSTKPRAKPKVLILGWDAADAELIERWCAEGLLPNICRMKAGGSWARLETTASTVHVSAWPSIFTGTAPDQHGLYHAYVARPGQQGPVRPQPDRTPFPFLWKILSDHGNRCIVMDAFLTCPVHPFNGSQIVDWGSWSHFWETTITPATLKSELEKKFGRYPAEDHSQIGMAPLSDFEGFHRRLLAGVVKKTEVVKWLMNREEWDLLLVVFGEAHPAGHYFWQFHDPDYLTHPKQGAGALGAALREVYIALDRSFGEILRNADDMTTVFLVSGDGIGPNYSGAHILPELLARMGLYQDNTVGGDGRSQEKTSGGDRTRLAKGDLLSALRNMVPEPLRIAVTKTLLPRSVQEKLSLRWKKAGILWGQTRAFLIENSNEGYIRINLRGREPEGIVEAGKEYERLCDEIYSTVKTMTNPANGKLAARAVYKTDDIYRGPCRSHMPDIIINWDEGAKITTEILTEKYGIVRSKKPNCALPPYYTGNHRPNAFLLSMGPEIPRGVINGASILDIAPTVLGWFGIEAPDYMEGRVLAELRCPSETGVLRRAPAQYAD
ncbi:MAG TPA: alkaline phosphatase family protein [Candidatus Binatia bacterium]|nr:alkaline phosphatase family protein [Candidatus Binatia bacterium]